MEKYSRGLRGHTANVLGRATDARVRTSPSPQQERKRLFNKEGVILMAYIYVITNKTNQKQYVGKTEHIEPTLRFQEHIKESRQSRNENRPLYSAFKKYGIDNFSFTILEEVSSTEASQKEIYWISKLNTYGSSGYNATLGGDGTSYLDYQKIIKDYKKVGNLREAAKMNDCHVHSVRSILKKFNIPIKTSKEVMVKNFQRKLR